MFNTFIEGQKNNLSSNKIQKIPGISNDSNNKATTNSKQSMDLCPLGRITQHVESSKILIVEGADANFIADEGTEIYDSSGAFIGQISIIFGPQKHPHYSISLIQNMQNLGKDPTLLMGISQQIFYNPVKTKPAEVEESRSTMTDDGLSHEENPDDSFDEEDQKRADILEAQVIGATYSNHSRMQNEQGNIIRHEDDFEDDFEDNVVMEDLGNSNSNNNNIGRDRKRFLPMVLSSSSSDEENDNTLRLPVKASTSTVSTSKPMSTIPSSENSDYNIQNDNKKKNDDSQNGLFAEPLFVLPPKKQHH